MRGEREDSWGTQVANSIRGKLDGGVNWSAWPLRCTGPQGQKGTWPEADMMQLALHRHV